MRERRPAAYIKPYFNGRFMFERTVTWLAKDRWGNTVARGRTRRKVEQETRRAGYIPVRGD